MKTVGLFLGILLAVTPAHATWQTPTQIVFNNSCAASTSCSVTVSAIGAGHLLVVVGHNGNATTLASVTAAGETFTLVPSGNCQGFNFSTETNCAYVLASAGGATTVTCNWNGTASATNTTCGFYEVPYTAQSISFGSVGQNNNTASSTPAGFNFSGTLAGAIQGYNNIEFQFMNVASGTISAIDSSYVLDNHTGQVADAHLLNTIKANAPTWTNSGSAASIATGLSFSENFTFTPAAFPQTGKLQAAFDNFGLDGTQRLIITSPGLFQLGFENADNWGLDQWFDLVNDPNATTNLLQPACPVNSCTAADLKSAEPGIFNVTYYDFVDEKQSQKSSHYFFPNAPRSLTVIEYSPGRIVVETKGLPAVTATDVLNNIVGTVRYYIYPNGQIYVHYLMTATNSTTLNSGIDFNDITLEDPTQTGTNPPDSQGWIRATPVSNPWDGTGSGTTQPYLFAYWGPSTPSPYTNYTKASIMIVHHPSNSQGGEIIHSWGSGPGFGVVRWGWTFPGATMALGAGGTIAEDYLIQLGTQGSTVLPNITSSTVAAPIATAYINNPTPPLVTSISTAVNQGAQVQFTSNLGSGTWALSGTDGSGNPTSGAGTMTSGGSYTAPASVTAQQTMGGFQLLPNNHVFNTRIDSLPVNSNNTAWMNVVNVGAGQPAEDLQGIPHNYIASAPILQNMGFFYTGVNNGVHELPSFPSIRQQGGYFDALSNGNRDHHLFSMDTSTGRLTEFYQTYAQAPVTSCSVNGSNVVNCVVIGTTTSSGFLGAAAAGLSVQIGSFSGADTWANVTCPLTSATSISITFSLTGAAGCATHGAASTTTSGQATLNTAASPPATAGTPNSQSGFAYTYADYALPSVSTNAAGTAIQPLELRLQEMERAVATSGTVNHAQLITFGLGFLASSNIWPATQFANDGGTVPFGARVRLKSSFNISSYSAIAQVMLKQMQQYGWIVTDGGNNWPSESESNAWPVAYVNAMNEVGTAGISCTITNTQVVTGTATVTCPNSFAVGYRVFITGTTNDGGILNNAWYVLTAANSTSFQFSFGTNFASAADTGNARSGLANYMEFVDESGLMVSATSGVTTHNREIVTFTRTSDSTTVSTDIALQGVAVNFPQDYLYIMAGNYSYQIPVLVNIGSVTWSMSPSIGSLSSNGVFTPPTTLASATTSTFTATSTVNSNVAAQLNVIVFPNTGVFVLPSQNANFTDSFGNVWVGGYGVGTNYAAQLPPSQPTIPAITNHQLWDQQIGNGGNSSADPKMNFIVPNGTYQVTYRYGVVNTPGFLRNTLSVGSNTFYSNGDMSSDAGGANKPFSQVTGNVVVTNNQLNVGAWTGGTGSGVTNVGAPISSLSIIPGASAAAVGHLP